MSNKRENLTWLPFAFLGALNVVGLIAFLWAWVALQVVQPKPTQPANAVVAQTSKSCPFEAKWGAPAIKQPVQKLKANKKKNDKKKYPFKMNLLSI